VRRRLDKAVAFVWAAALVFSITCWLLLALACYEVGYVLGVF
jgi:hypothetical protein